MKTLIHLLFLSLLVTGTAYACPDIANLLDTDCNGVIRFSITGDSIVKGISDKKEIGYPGRLELKVDNDGFKVINIGIPGADAVSLMRGFVKYIDRGGKTTKNTTDIDYMLIQVGTNAYWSDRKPFQEAAKIRRLKKWLERNLEERNGVKPVVFTAAVPPTERSFQNPYLQQLNKELLRIKNLNVRVRFDTIPVNQLFIHDTLHPSGKGYAVMAKKVRQSLFGSIKKQARKRFHDTDGDGLYNAPEVGRFLTDPKIADTDGDGLSDGEEILVYKTNPKLADTDGDSITDRDEILGGTDPLAK